MRHDAEYLRPRKRHKNPTNLSPNGDIANFSKRSSETYQPVQVEWSTFDAYQKAVHRMYRAAGVLPYRYNQKKKRLEILLGEENRRKAKQPTWCEFGGKRDEEDSDLFDTVAREFSEETCGVLSGNHKEPSVKTLKESIKRVREKLTMCFPKDGVHYKRLQQNTFSSEHSLDTIALQVYVHFGKYVIFVLPFHDDPLPSRKKFETCVKINNDPDYQGEAISEAQKHTYKWYSLSEVLAHRDTKSPSLYPFFAQMLREFKNDLIALEKIHRHPQEWKNEMEHRRKQLNRGVDEELIALGEGDDSISMISSEADVVERRKDSEDAYRRGHVKQLNKPFVAADTDDSSVCSLVSSESE